MTSPLLDFFTALVTEADLVRLVDERVPESIHLEFKTKKHPSNASLDESDSFQFSKALSGFANSDGGILIWGVATDAEERASELRPIAAATDFLSRLKKSLLDAVQPSIDGVRLESIATASDQGKGYVKCLVPASQRAPHRAMLAKREYYKRSTEGFYRLEHFDLEDMFGRRPKPVLELRTRFAGRGGMTSGGIVTFNLQLILAIANTGRGTASQPYLAFRLKAPYALSRFGLDGNGNHGLPRHISGDTSTVVFGGVGVAIHAGIEHDVTTISVEVRKDGSGGESPIATLQLSYILAAEGIASSEGELTIPPDEIRRGLTTHYPSGSP